MRFIEVFNETVKNYPERIAVDDLKRSITYRELDIESAKVYAYLRHSGIGSEDIVLIFLSRSVGIIVSMLGIIKAGAAFISLEKGYPEERVEYIKHDAKPKLIITDELYQTIIKTEESLLGYEETNLHDMACIFYTSGSTGNPKGAIHEYGNLDLLTFTARNLTENKLTFSEIMVPVPSYFITCLMQMTYCIVQVNTLVFVDLELLKDYHRLTDFIYKRKFKAVYLSPSYIRIYKNPSPYLEIIITGGESATHIYYEGGKPLIANGYGMSESGFMLFRKYLDKSYDMAPIGTPLIDADFHLVDETGQRDDEFEKGELCFKHEYFRGYLNLPEITAKVLRNGYFYTGDIAKRDKNGDYYIIGRKDDMFKINGNRIAPAEIEIKIKEVTGLKPVVAKGFKIDEREFICLYYLKKQAQDLGILKDGKLDIDKDLLAKSLPAYMLPTYYIGLDDFPINANGKLSKKELLPPEISTTHEKYVPATNEIEENFCKMMANVLRIENVGVNDDFYSIGGDSISSIELIADCIKHGYNVTVSSLYEYRTPRKLATKYVEKLPSREILIKNELEARKQTPGLLSRQAYYIKKILQYPNSMYANLREMVQLKENVNPKRFREAVNRVFAHHPVFMTKFIKNENGEYVHKYDETSFKPLKIIELSDDEFDKVVKKEPTALSLSDAPMYKYNLYSVNGRLYFYIQIHHIITDGVSLKIIREQIYECYMNPEYILPTDYYYTILLDNEQNKHSENYNEAKNIMQVKMLKIIY